MTDGDALLAAIHEAPEDDAPRLILSDWLDENDQPERAEFIRIQVAMRRERDAHPRITQRLDTLFVQSRDLFYRPWAELVRDTFGRGIGGYSRGFPTGPKKSIPVQEFIARLPTVRSWLGPQTAVVLRVGTGDLATLASRPELQWVRDLAILRLDPGEATLTDANVADLCFSPYLTRLRSLDLSTHGLGAKSAIALARAPLLRTLVSLDLRNNRLGRTGVKALANAPHLASLRQLDLRGNQLGDSAAWALLKSPYLTNLRTLWHSDNRFSQEVGEMLRVRFPEPDPWRWQSTE